MRHILVEYARARDAQKRPDPRLRIPLSEVDAASVEARASRMSSRSTRRCRASKRRSRASRVVELRYFTGLSEREAAEALGVSLSTLKRDWNFAKAWLIDSADDRPQRAGSNRLRTTTGC